MTKKRGDFGSTMGMAGFGSYSFVGASMGQTGFGSFAHVGQMIQKSGAVTRRPHIYLALEMGEFCPLQCKHCIYESELSRSKGRPREDVMSAIEASLHTITPTWISFAGKEPTAYPDELARMMGAAKRETASPTIVMTNGLKTSTIVMTNGLKPVAPLFEAGLVDISLDGDEKAHDWCRGKGTFVRTMRNVHALVATGKRVGIIATAMNHTLPDGRRQVEAVGALARKLGEEFTGRENISLTISLYYGRPGDPMILTEVDLRQLLDVVRDTGITVRILWVSNYAPASYTFLRPLWDGLEYDESGIPFIRDGNLLHLVFNVAKEPLLGMRVSRNGDVYVGCNHLTYTPEKRQRFSVGSIFENTLGELVDKVLAGDAWLGDLAPAEACGSCERFSVCHGGDTLTGMYEGRSGDPFCELIN